MLFARRIMLRVLLVAGVAGACRVEAAAQTTIHVPADQPTIQAAINAASNGDTVMVSPGTYNENIDFKGKGITVTTQTGLLVDAAATVLSGIGGGPVVSFGSAEPTTAKLAGFSIANSTTVAISISAGSPTITNDLIAGGHGCGIIISGSQSSPTVASNEIKNISVPAANCGNAAAGGAAISVSNAGNVSITGNSIHDIDTTAKGVNISAGVSVGSASTFAPSNVYFANNVIRNTTSNGAPALIGNVNGTFVMVQNEIYDNTGGGGVEIMGDSPAAFHPGTFSATAVNNTIYGNTFGGNVVPTYGEQFYSSGIFVAFVASNNIFRSADAYAAVTCNFINSSNATFANNDVSDEGASSPPTCTGVMSQNNLFSDPQFVDPATGDFHTQRTSPVVAAGDINAPDILSTDYDKRNRTVCGTIDMGIYEIHPQPATEISSSNNPAVGGTSVTLTALVPGNCNVPTGTVTFLDGTNTLGTQALNAGASASLSTANLTVGSHTITVTYPGDFNFDASTSSPFTQVVTGYPTSTSIVVTPNPAGAFQSITLSSTVLSANGIPTGTVTFTANGKPLATAPLQANGSASTTVSTLGAGTYSIVATYSADVNFEASSSSPTTEIVTGADSVVSLAASPNPSTIGQTVTFQATVRAAQGSAIPTGTITFTEGGNTLGSGTLDANGKASFGTSTLNVGAHSITARYAGSGNFNPSSSSVSEVVNVIPTTVVLSASPNPAATGQAVTILATVSSNSSTPSGVITFFDGSAILGTATANATGQASLTTSALAIGTHVLTASYQAGPMFGGSTSNAVQESVLPSSFAVALSPSTINLSAGRQGTVSVQLSSVGLFAGSLGLSHGSLPQYLSASFNPSSVALIAGSSNSATLTIGTTASMAMMNQGQAPRPFAPKPLLAGLAFGAMFLLPFGFRPRQKLRIFSVLLLAVASQALTGCTNRYYELNLVAPGTYQVPITATDGSGNSKTSTLTIIVTP
jgi:hypothetical protein